MEVFNLTIFLCSVLLIFIILLIKIRLVIGYNDKLSVNIKFLFFNIDVLSVVKKAKKDENKKEKIEKKEKAPPEKSKSFLNILNKINKALSTNLFDFKKGIIINKLKMRLQVGIDDAKDTALICGHFYNAISAIDTLIINNFNIKDKNISITPRFNELVFALDFLLDIKASIINLMAITFLVFINIKKKN